MAETIRFIRDSLTIDQNLISNLHARPGDTLVIAGRQVTLSTLLPAFDYVIAADQLILASTARISLTGVLGNPSPAVTILARNINRALAVTAAGMAGKNGANGENGESGIEQPDGGGKPIIGPGGNGGNGENGGKGGDGGSITIRYFSAPQPPAGTSPGGPGGSAGKGGKGGPGRPPGKKGRDGKRGATGKSGLVDIVRVGTDEVWKVLDSTSTQQWSAYRAEVGGFFFRKFDFASQLTALEEARNALILNPGNAEAVAIHDRIINRQIPSGLARDLDIAPDFRSLSANLFDEISIVQNSFELYVSVVNLETIAESIRDTLRIMVTQVANRRTEAQADVAIAEQDVRIVQAQISNIQAQIDDIDKQIEEIRESRFSIAGIISDVGSIASVAVGMGTGVGAIISIAGGLATLRRQTEDSDLVEFFKFMSEKPDPNSVRSEDFEEIKKLGGGFKDLIEGTKSFISFGKVIGDLENAMSIPGQDAIGKLLKQQVLLVREKMVAGLRATQARSRVAAAQLRVSNLENEIRQIQDRLDHWNTEAATLEAATNLLIRSARDVVDSVMEDVFLAQRAREIYQLDPIAGLRFDFGYLHPDVDRSLTPAVRASESLISLSGMAIQILAWDQIFTQLNTAQIGFDVIHPQLSVAITDPAKLNDFANGAILDFSIDLADTPEKMFELKVNAMTLELVGASSSRSVNILITHSGTWSMKRRDDGSITELNLLPRSEVFACSPATGTLRAKIPANQSSSEPGPPFSFWGRGVATKFRLKVAQPSVADLSQLSAINLTIDCIGYATQGFAGAIKPVRPEVRSARSSSG
jgi:prefoldin subunit 5